MAAGRNPAWMVLFVLLALGALGLVLHPGSGKSLVPWRSDVASARQVAMQSGKPLFLDFSASWCGPCQWMKSNTWTDRSVAQALDGFVPVAVDVDAQPELAAQYHVSVIPTMMVIDPRTAAVVKQTEGALSPEDFVHWLGKSPLSHESASVGVSGPLGRS